jgi:hypothetical protein
MHAGSRQNALSSKIMPFVKTSFLPAITGVNFIVENLKAGNKLTKETEYPTPALPGILVLKQLLLNHYRYF